MINLSNHDVKITYKNKNLSIIGGGNILLQDKQDKIDYSISKTNNKYTFNTSIKIKKNPIIINLLNFKNSLKDDTLIKVQGDFSKKKINLDLFSLEEKNNKILIKNISFDDKHRVIEMRSHQIRLF